MYKLLFFILLACALYNGWRENKISLFFHSLTDSRLWMLLLLSFSLIPLDLFVSVARAKGFWSYVSKLGNTMGDADIVMPIVLFLFCLSVALKLDYLRDFLLELICIVVLILVLGNLFKMGFGRARPYMGLGEFSFFNFPDSIFKNGFQSFPSGHMFFATSLFGWIGMRLGGWMKLLSLIIIAIVAYNRLETHNHFFSDVAFSVALGYILLISYSREVKMAEKASSFSPLVSLSFFKRVFLGGKQGL
ncbi:MAG: superfamily [bacterium]|nr:superfamily [bacterium]